MLSRFARFLRRNPPPPKLVTSEAVTLFFLELFRGHGLACELRDGWIVANTGSLKAQALLFPRPKTQSGVCVQLDLVMLAGTGDRIIESTGGVGDSIESAVSVAVKAMCEGSFHVIFKALTGLECSHCDVEEWDIAGRTRTVFLGPVIGWRPNGNTQPAPTRWFQDLEPRIRSLELGPGLHWIRLYHFESRGLPPISEVLIDNKDCPSLRSELEAVEWPQPDDFYSARMFLMVADRNPPLEPPSPRAGDT